MRNLIKDTTSIPKSCAHRFNPMYQCMCWHCILDEKTPIPPKCLSQAARISITSMLACVHNQQAKPTREVEMRAKLHWRRRTPAVEDEETSAMADADTPVCAWKVSLAPVNRELPLLPHRRLLLLHVQDLAQTQRRHARVILA